MYQLYGYKCSVFKGGGEKLGIYIFPSPFDLILYFSPISFFTFQFFFSNYTNSNVISSSLIEKYYYNCNYSQSRFNLIEFNLEIHLYKYIK